MNIFDGSLSDVEAEESQATQLIHAALEQSPGSSEGHTKGGVTAADKDSSIESYPSSKNSATSSVNQYHFHGLAMSQTQTQIYEEGSANGGILPGEGSQKENFQAAPGGKAGKDIRWGMPSPDSRPPSPHGSVVEEKVTKAGRKGFQAHPTKPNIPPAASPFFVKNPPPLTTRATMGHQPMKARGRLNSPPRSLAQRNTRSHSPVLSDDSFAQGDSQLSEEKYLVTSKKFTMPLADLAAAADEDDLSTMVSGPREMERPKFLSRSSAGKRDDSPAVILVSATPSQSGSSDCSEEEPSKSEPPPPPPRDDNIGRAQDTSRVTLDSDSNKGSQHSQGYDGHDEVAEVQDLYSNKRDASRVPTSSGPPPSSVDSEETQAATQIATQSIPEQTTSSNVPQTNTSTRTGPRSLLSTMDPNKRGRYQHLLQHSPASPLSTTPKQFPAGTYRMTVDGAETQPSEVAEQLLPQAIPLKPRTVPLLLRKASPKELTHRHYPPPPSAETDIIPDSEPLREQLQSPAIDKHLGLRIDAATPKTQGKEQITEGPSHEDEETEDDDAPPPRKVMRREEEEESDEDDLPLSARLRKNKGKASAVPTNRKATGVTHTYSSKGKDNKNITKTQTTKLSKQPDPPRQKNRKTSKSQTPALADMSLVPSSVPGEEHAPPTRSRKPSAKAAIASKEKGKQPVRKTPKAMASARSVRSLRSTTNEAGGGSDVEMEGPSDSEEATEPALDEEEDEYEEPEIPQQNHKRKRGRQPKAKPSNQVVVTPRTRLTKRLKSAGSTMSRANATKVFALWGQSGLWYSGVVHERISGDAYNVKFDDGFESVVTVNYMRINQLRVGDLVRVSKRQKELKIVGINSRSNTVEVDIEGEEGDLPIKDISISTRTINSMWQDRIIDKRTVVPVLREVENKPTPSPSRSAASFPSASLKGSRSQHKFLQKVGLIVTLSGNNTNDRTKDGRTRSDILNAVREGGGVVVDDMFKYLKMDISYSPTRCAIQSSDVQWVGEARELQRLFLLADDCNLKPKYLMALALGIPCLSINWLYDCLDVKKELDWRSYLLPQGRPTAFDILPSQQIDLNWGNQLEHLVYIISNPVAPKILQQKSVLCIGPDMTPKRKDDKAGEAASYILRIILAMGATRVEAVADISNALMSLSQYDLFIIREKDQYISSYPQDRTADWNWVKDSLIMSRVLPYPSWDIEDDSQCSQSL